MAESDMTKKRRRGDTTESSSSEETAPLMAQKDVLELGRYLVRELGFEKGVDTLGRWMAHHLAQLMDAVEQATTERKRVIAQKAATETILKIWEHRAVIPGKAYPLHSLEEVLPVLKRLQPDNNPFDYFRNYSATKRERLAADLFDSLTRLIIVLFWMKLPQTEEEDTSKDYIVSTLNETEQYILKTIQSWEELIIPEEKAGGSSQPDEDQGENNEFDTTKFALQLINNISATLATLKADLEGNADEEEDVSWVRIYEQAFEEEEPTEEEE